MFGSAFFVTTFVGSTCFGNGVYIAPPAYPIDVADAIFQRLDGDSSLRTLLGGSGRILHAFEPGWPKAGSITYHKTTAGPGGIDADDVQVVTEFYQFNIYHNRFPLVSALLYRLLHQNRFTPSPEFTIKRCLFDWEGPDEFDEDLKVRRKHVRYKVDFTRSAQSPL